MPKSHVWFGLVALVLFSLAADSLCRAVVSGGYDPRELAQAAVALGELPPYVGSWHATTSEQLSDRIVEMLQCAGHKHQVYVNEETGESVSVTLLVGPAGPMLAHRPEICYASADFEQMGATEAQIVRGEGERAEIFDRASFRAKALAGETQRVYYGWRPPQGRWQAPRNPRLALGGNPWLYKLQLAAVERHASLASADDAPPTDACRQLLAALLPELDRMLVTR